MCKVMRIKMWVAGKNTVESENYGVKICGKL